MGGTLLNIQQPHLSARVDADIYFNNAGQSHQLTPLPVKILTLSPPLGNKALKIVELTLYRSSLTLILILKLLVSVQPQQHLIIDNH